MKHLSAALGLLISTLLWGCSHYHLGHPGTEALPFKKLYIAPVLNDSFTPQASVLVTEQLHQWLHLSGVETTHCKDEADAELIITLTHYERSASTTLEEDTEVASSFTVSLEASVTLRDFCGNCYLGARPISASITALANTSFNNSVQTVLYHDMPVLTRKLAKSISNLVTGAW